MKHRPEDISCVWDAIKRFAVLICGALTMAACGAYTPAMVDIPLIAHQGDGHADLSISTLNSYSYASLNGSLSYGLTDEVAIQVAGGTDFEHNGHVMLAAGRYHAAADGRMVMEFYGGVAAGRMHTYNALYDEPCYECYETRMMPGGRRIPMLAGGNNMETGYYGRFFAQADFGLVSIVDLFDIGMAHSLGYTMGHLDEHHGLRVEQATVRGRTGLLATPLVVGYDISCVTLGSHLMLRVGGRHLKFTAQLGWEIPLLSFGDRAVGGMSLSCGMNYRF
ncbi:MAG: hypothetical protein IJ620_04815 [Bacteroidales bacterium]|nr:hypothetical protein [Bacteroidales bacterium]